MAIIRDLNEFNYEDEDLESKYSVNSNTNRNQAEIFSSNVRTKKSLTVQGSTVFDKLFESEKYKLLYKELKKNGITTLDSLRKIHLLSFMNLHNLYSCQRRLAISTELTAKLKLSENKYTKPSSSACEIYYNGVTYTGGSPSEVFVVFLGAVAARYPLKISSLLESRHPKTGKVVLSRYYSDTNLRVMDLDAYVDSELSMEDVKLYKDWVLERCSETSEEYTAKEKGNGPESPVKSLIRPISISNVKGQPITNTYRGSTLKHNNGEDMLEAKEKHETEQMVTAFDKFFELEKYELLYKELKKRGITTFDDLKAIHLWSFMNLHKLYSVQRRLEISTELTAKLKSAENNDDELSAYVCEIYYNGVTYKGTSQSEAFLLFLTAIATKYPLKIRSLLDCIHPKTGKVVVSRYYSDSKLRMINPDVYVDSDLSLEQVKLYIAWVLERCGAVSVEYTIKEKGMSIEAPIKSFEESRCYKSADDADTFADDTSQAENRLNETPAQGGVCNPELSLTQEVEDYLLQCDLTGATYDELQSKLDDTMIGTKRFVAKSPHIIEMNKRLYHVDVFVDFDEGADTLEAVLDKLLKKNNSIATAKQLYEYARSEMAMFLNDNGITEQQSVYDLARHLFEKVEYHGKKYVFRSNMYISLPEVSAGSVIDIIKKYAREKGSTITYKETESYLAGLGLKTGNLRGMMRIDKEPEFFVYAENEYLLAELMHIDDAFLKAVHSALLRLFSDCNGHIILRHISDSWYNLLPSLPASLSWTPMLLQQLISFYQDELEARTVIAMESQNSNTLHVMLVEKESWIQDFRDVVAIFLHDEMPNRSEFEAEELRKILVDAGMISGNQLIRHMHICLGGDPRFLWSSDGSHVKVGM